MTGKAPSKLLGIDLSVSADKVKVYEYRPSEQLLFVEIYVAWSDTLEGFEMWVGSNAMHMRGDPAGADVYLPAPWLTEVAKGLDWWGATEDTPTSSAEMVWGTSGWLVTKFEAGVVYVYATDTGIG